MDKCIIFPLEEADGGIAIMVPVASFRGKIVVKEAKYEEAFQELKFNDGVDEETGEEKFRVENRSLGLVCVEEEESRPETDEEFLERVARKDVPNGVPFEIVTRADAEKRRADGRDGVDPA